VFVFLYLSRLDLDLLPHLCHVLLQMGEGGL
jgi:hypothetical protein